MRRGRVMAVGMWAWATAASANEGLAMTLETSNGNRAPLSVLRGKPTVLFYEDRDSNQLNQGLKDALFQRARQKGMLDAARVVAVANVQAWNWFPARTFVLKAVRDIEHKVKVPVYLDFEGKLTAPPWNLSPTSSTVVVLDPAGRETLRHEGRLDAGQIEQVLAMLERLAVPSAGP